MKWYIDINDKYFESEPLKDGEQAAWVSRQINTALINEGQKFAGAARPICDNGVHFVRCIPPGGVSILDLKRIFSNRLPGYDFSIKKYPSKSDEIDKYEWYGSAHGGLRSEPMNIDQAQDVKAEVKRLMEEHRILLNKKNRNTVISEEGYLATRSVEFIYASAAFNIGSVAVVIKGYDAKEAGEIFGINAKSRGSIKQSGAATYSI